MKALITALLLSFSMFFCHDSIAQSPKIPKYGKDIENDLKITSCAMDSSAHAIVLFDNGTSIIKYNSQNGEFYVEINRHTRIKILDKDGLEYADITIPLYRSNTLEEQLGSFKAVTYNLVNGKVEKVNQKRKDMFKEETSNRLSLMKATLPQVVEGSVIEYSYTVISPFIYGLQHWEFQSSIPTLISNYVVEIPEYFNYNNRISGYENIKTSKDYRRESIVVTQQSIVKEGNVRETSTYKIEYNVDIYNFYGQNIPKLRDEVFVDNITNYQSRVDFELLTTNFPNSTVKQFTSSWDQVTKDLLNDIKFGKELNRSNFLKDDIQNLISGKDDPNEKMLAVFSHIKEKIKWNDRYRLRTDKGIKDAYSDGSGNSADVNLCLVVALREAGLDAFPIALSTRSTGLLLPWEISYSKLNHVIAGVSIDNNIITLDATSSFSAPNILPLECLNGNARIIDERRLDWIDLYPKVSSKMSITQKMSLSESDQVFGSVESIYRDYSAMRIHQTLNGDDDLSQYKETLQKNYKTDIVDSIKVKQTLLPNPEITVGYNVSIPESVVNTGEFIYLTPGVGVFRTKNPFVTAERILPINFHFPFEEIVMLKYSIPEGYELFEKPENLILRLSESKGQFVYSISQIGNEVMVISRLNINKTLFVPTDYPEIKNFYDLLVNKSSEKLVFKKVLGV
jgi:hypothetical protein